MSLIMIMGIPASGKSTFCQRLLKYGAPNLVQSTSMDEFMVENAQESARCTRKSFESHVESLLLGGDHKVWLIEDVFYLRSMRRSFQRMARRRGFQFGIVYLKVEMEEAMRRNAKRDRREKEETIQRVAEQMEEPDNVDVKTLVLENPDEVGNVEELMRRLGMKRVAEVPKAIIRNSPATRDDERPRPRQNLDVISRRLVSEIKIENPGFDGKKLSEARKIILSTCQDIQEVDVLKEQLMRSFYRL